ncbi:nucleoid-associated protein [Sinanaerobacter chloroacetimidivorans]|uniref:Nucleoid-associated protein n=1 Tax=Sinanaerobacter chloroacetimidivorans TaxID=2818044 RepID=A0A8J7VZX3_9FIRM|nr:nucleoid-associated protein [Sinanaerobacter chloroacetimidivorans]MBR0596450.1 nucleoid-associated protein [Sinanaerobacter chloroacetimidivorans]
MIIYKSFHNIDVSNGALTRKEIPPDFTSFVNEYIRFATRNDSIKMYTVHDDNTTVVNCIGGIVSIAADLTSLSDEQKGELDSYSHSIADKLLREEQQAQERIAATGKQIKKGSLIQAFVKTDTDEYIYIIAKVEHSEWYDGESLQKNFGFPSEKKNVWKSAVFPLLIDEETSFDTVRIYTDNDAKYWATQFLELNEERSDQTNTSTAFNAMEMELKRKVKKQSERDYYNLRNTLIHTMKTPQQINYSEFVNALVGGYQPDKADLDLTKLQAALLELPEKKNFDRQFNTIPDAIKKRRRLKFPVTTGIELSIAEDVENYRDAITAKTHTNGSRYIEIACEENSTYELFCECNVNVMSN